MDNTLSKDAMKPWTFSDPIYTDLIVSKNLIYDPCQFQCSNLAIELEGVEYGACLFELNSIHVRFRVAKITPTRIGQFVTLWKRVGKGPIQPYDMTDKAEIFVITTRKYDHFGQFIFPKAALYKHGIISNNGQGGKLAIRLYPPWDITTNYQAKKTQAWQAQYFLETPTNQPIDFNRVKMLYNHVIAPSCEAQA